MTSTTTPPRRAHTGLIVGTAAVGATVLAVILGLLLDVSPLSARSATRHPAPPQAHAAHRAPTVSRGGDDHAPAPASPAPRPASGTHLMVDLASAPSLRTVRRWQKHSPYQAIGVYLHVARAADDRHDKVQRNLTASWVDRVRAGGWQVLPIYLGLQAPRGCQSGAFHAMSGDPIAAERQGVAAADDAAGASRALGLTSVPLMYDMEPYRAGCGASVRAFFLGWTARLHQLGRLAGIYGLPSSAGRDLLAAGADYVEPDVMWAATANGSPSTVLHELPRTAWRGHRANQFALDVHRRYGGKRLAVDDSAVDDGVWSLAPAKGADHTAPVVTVAEGATVLSSRRAVWRWLAVDEHSRSVAYESDVRRTQAGGPLGAWSAPAASGHHAQLKLRAGEQACVRVRARDAAGNSSHWVRRCVSRLADDKVLRRLSGHPRGWHGHHQHGAFHRTVTVAAHRHAKLTLGHAERGDLGVLVRGRGAVIVRVGGRRVGVLRSGGLRWVHLHHAGQVTLVATEAHVAVDGFVLAPR